MPEFMLLAEWTRDAGAAVRESLPWWWSYPLLGSLSYLWRELTGYYRYFVAGVEG